MNSAPTRSIAPGRSVLYPFASRSGTDGSPDYQHRYWGMAWYVWNNSGDTAYVRNASGTLIDSCTWGSSGSYTYC